MIAKYPKFSKLEFSHKEFISNFTSEFEPHSDFNFVSLYSWDTDKTAEISLLNDNLVIRIPDYISGKPVVSVIGKTKIHETLTTLHQNETATIKLLPEFIVGKAEQNKLFDWIEDEDNHDYVFDLKSQATLKGGKYKNKRKKSHKFIKKYEGRVEMKQTKLDEKETVSRIMNVFDNWAKHISKDEKEAKNERKAVERLLEKAPLLDLVCDEIFLDGKPVGFSINELVGNGYAVCHFHKTDTKHDNIDVFFTSHVAKQLVERGCLFVNWEQDLGIAGLRHLKKSWKPVKVLKKHRITSK